MATIQVAIRCKTFVSKDKLGVQLLQNSEDPPASEVNVLNSTVVGDRARYAFSYAWWSANNYKTKLPDDDIAIADEMKLVSQSDVYAAVGEKVKADLYGGSAVVMFAYGLSGSGKTFTVFGPDAVDSPDAWFKHSEPHKLWGILPNLAYQMFQEKKDDWKITMKYFQNVVDIVRDLLSPNSESRQYKQGMTKDEDGFMDITWCQSIVLHSWDDFRAAFRTANGKKAISPTQFNHQSTRGHCIMTLELEKPVEGDPTRKQRGRLYVCDLAGTEPAGDIYYAQYKTDIDANGDKEYTLVGPHADQSKTKELQDQGKKINLSLSEMAQFFMKMAEAVMKNTLKPGASIPGCNSYFLCKYLKDTILQAKTYLVCAIRPEVSFHKYTFATLGFAKNASVIKIQPKKAGAGVATAGEKKLMAELEELKAVMAEMQRQNTALQAADTGGDEEEAKALKASMAELQAKNMELLAAIASPKEDEASDSIENGGFTAEDMERAIAGKVTEMQKLQEESAKSTTAADHDQLRARYANFGIALAELDGATALPHFINLDMDEFRSGTFMFILSKPEMVFGPKGDFRPQSLAVVPQHCTVTLSAAGEVTITAGNGPTFVNGSALSKGQARAMKPFDRLAVGGELLLLRTPNKEPVGIEPPTAESAIEEYREGLVKQATTSGATSLGLPDAATLPGQPDGAKVERKGLSEAASKRIDEQIQVLLPKLDQARQLCIMVDPETPLEFNLALMRTSLLKHADVDDVEVRVNVTNPATSQSIALSAAEFNSSFSMLNDELAHLRDAVMYGGMHTIATENRPVVMFFDHMVHLGTCVVFTEFLQYNMESDPDDSSYKIFNVAPGEKEKVHTGTVEGVWTPLASPYDDGRTDIVEVDEASMAIGKPWTYRFELKAATGLPISVHEVYIEYDFFGERCISELQEFEKGTRTPDFKYSFTHHVSNVTQEFLDFLVAPLELKVFATPYVFFPPTGISASDPGVAERVAPGTIYVPPTAAGSKAPPRGNSMETMEDASTKTMAEMVKENAELRMRVQELQANATATGVAFPEVMKPSGPRTTDNGPVRGHYSAGAGEADSTSASGGRLGDLARVRDTRAEVRAEISKLWGIAGLPSMGEGENQEAVADMCLAAVTEAEGKRGQPLQDSEIAGFVARMFCLALSRQT